jgi:hypothetical protein
MLTAVSLDLSVGVYYNGFGNTWSLVLGWTALIQWVAAFFLLIYTKICAIHLTIQNQIRAVYSYLSDANIYMVVDETLPSRRTTRTTDEDCEDSSQPSSNNNTPVKTTKSESDIRFPVRPIICYSTKGKKSQQERVAGNNVLQLQIENGFYLTDKVDTTLESAKAKVVESRLNWLLSVGLFAIIAAIGVEDASIVAVILGLKLAAMTSATLELLNATERIKLASTYNGKAAELLQSMNSIDGVAHSIRMFPDKKCVIVEIQKLKKEFWPDNADNKGFCMIKLQCNNRKEAKQAMKECFGSIKKSNIISYWFMVATWKLLWAFAESTYISHINTNVEQNSKPGAFGRLYQNLRVVFIGVTQRREHMTAKEMYSKDKRGAVILTHKMTDSYVPLCQQTASSS